MDTLWTPDFYISNCLWIKQKAETSPRILNLLLDHVLGKPLEHIQQEQVTFVMHLNRNTDAQDAEVIDAEQKYLPEREKE